MLLNYHTHYYFFLQDSSIESVTDGVSRNEVMNLKKRKALEYNITKQKITNEKSRGIINAIY